MSEITRPSDLVLAVQPDRDRAIVRLVGELDLAVTGCVEAAVEELVGAGVGDIVVDLRGLTFMDSAGVHMLLSTKRRTEQASCCMSVVPGRRVLHRVLTLTGAEPLFRFVPAETIEARP